jgi:Kef-type K+ transport system membrane component KefB
MLVAVIGVVVPFVVGAFAGIGLGWSSETAIFLGAALTATSVGITARVFGDLRALATTEARIVLGAAVADDVLGLLILTVVVKVVTGDSVTVGLVATTVLAALGFLVLSGLVGLLLVPRLLDVISRFSRTGTTLTVAALVLILGLAVLADSAQLAFIIGAFMAGLALGRSRHSERVASDLNSVGGVFIPVFFVLIGVNADLGAMLQPSVLFDAAILFAIAVAGKLVSMAGAAGTRSDRLLIGIGMIPRGEVGLIFAATGAGLTLAGQPVIGPTTYAAIVLMVMVTTMVTPPLLAWSLKRAPVSSR